MFDCLEFSPALRWTDVMSDVAFMAMDLHSHGLAPLAHRFVDACMARSGDYAGLPVLRYYMVHRALVRAKVAALRAGQGARKPEAAAMRPAQHYLEVALACSRPAPPVLMLTHGFSGSGKTALTQSLLELCGAVRVRADVERKRLFGVALLARNHPARQLYAPAATAATQARLREAAALALRGGFPVILDATFLDFEHRQQARALARSLSARFVIIDFVAGEATLRERVRQRARRADDASDADEAVLEAQLARAQPLRPGEREDVQLFDAEPDIVDAAMAERWRPLLRRLGRAPASA
jgi:predicted kinase